MFAPVGPDEKNSPSRIVLALTVLSEAISKQRLETHQSSGWAMNYKSLDGDIVPP